MPGPDSNGNGHRYDPSNCWYWANGGAPVPFEQVPDGYGPTPSDPSWEQLDHLKGLLEQAVAWYERLLNLGYDGMPAHMRHGNPTPGRGEANNWHVALATAYQRVRELKGTVTSYRKELCRRKVPRQRQMMAPSTEDPDRDPDDARDRATRQQMAAAESLGARAPERPDESDLRRPPV